MGQRLCRIKDQKPLPGLAFKQDFAKTRALKLIVIKCKNVYFGRRFE